MTVSKHKTNYVSNAYITHALFFRSTDILKFPVIRTFLIVTQGEDLKQVFFFEKTEEQPTFFFFLALFPTLESDSLFKITEDRSTKPCFLGIH